MPIKRRPLIELPKRKRKSGYLQKFRHNIDLNSFGVDAEFIDWCKKHSKGSWGWWFWTHPDWYDYSLSEYDERAYGKNRAYMSFQYKRDALRFWFYWQKEQGNENKR